MLLATTAVVRLIGAFHEILQWSPSAVCAPRHDTNGIGARSSTPGSPSRPRASPLRGQGSCESLLFVIVPRKPATWRTRFGLAAFLVSWLVASHLPARGQSSSPDPEVDRAAGGFEHPILLIPEIGLWVDGVAELGFAKKTGLVIWWGLGRGAAQAGQDTLGGTGMESASMPTPGRVDWQRVAFRIRAEVWNDKGKRVARKQDIVDPLQRDAYAEGGGFPAPLRMSLKSGTYRVKLEAYPLISAAALGTERVPRGEAEAVAVVPQITYASKGWRLGDLLFLRSVRRWGPGAPPERTWYEWVVDPSAPRAFGSGSREGYVAFEVLRSEEPVPRCGGNSCRIVITITDTTGAVRQQDLRPVPTPASVSAYLVPIRPDELNAGVYHARVEVYDRGELQAAVSRQFWVVQASE